MDEFSVTTKIEVNIDWLKPSETEEQEMAREQFEKFLTYVANSINEGLAQVLVQSYEQSVREETGMDIFQGRKIEVI